jgi:N-acetylated-alpha-linked acidic dipeptidase
MKNKLYYLAVTLALCAFAIPPKELTGFTGDAAKTETDWETRFDNLMKPADIDSFIKYLSARPHHLGSDRDRENAEYILRQYKSWGYDARIDTFYALFATPKTRLLEEVSPGKFKASLTEPKLLEDATSGQAKEQLPTYNCYSADGDVTGELVYVNYGAPDDYEELAKHGIDVKGKIVIARYGSTWRGIKPRLAQVHGAIGCIIYSDPKDDGFYQDETYPKGPARSEDGVQRGSVLDMPLYPGDPLTPGYGDTKNAKRIDRKDAANLLKIPVLPISANDAKPLLMAIAGTVAPEKWHGALPFTYHMGPGPVQVHLTLEFNWDIKPVYDVIAMMRGSQFPDQWVMRGNHHDAWVNGADDPISGQAALLTEAKAVGQMVKEGFKPKRTIVYCSWDGEEEGLMGSTEFAETNAAELQQKVVAYINTDGNARGFLGAGGSHTLQKMANEIMRDVQDPEMNISVLKRKKAQEVAGEKSPKEQKEKLSSTTVKIDALGSGSDFSSFLQHLGIASLDFGYGGEDHGGEYHSIYDSYDMYRRFKDPGFIYGVVLAKTAGRATLRLANATVLPFEYHDFYNTLNDYVKEVTKKIEEMRANTEIENQLLKENVYTYASDPTHTFIPPKPKAEVPYIDFAPLQNAMAGLKNSTDQCKPLLEKAKNQPDSIINKVNVLLYQSERKLLLENGLPDRPWYKHAVYAPGYYTGYGVKTLPGIREAIENRNWVLAQQQIEAAAKVITAYKQQVDAVVDLLKEK